MFKHDFPNKNVTSYIADIPVGLDEKHIEMQSFTAPTIPLKDVKLVRT